MRISRFAPAAALLAVVLALPLVATALPIGGNGATVTDVAERLPAVEEDVVTVYNSGSLESDVESNAFRAAFESGADAAIGGSASIGMTAVRRGGATVQAAAPGWAYPMGTTVLPKDPIGRLMGNEVSGVLSDQTVVMSALTASLRGAQAGDTISLTATWGGQVTYEIGAIVADEITGGTELLMTPEAAARVGLQRKSRVVLWGFDSRDAVDDALADNGLISTSIRVRRSWDPFDPDFTIGMARTKEALGEFAFRVNGNGSVSIDSGWKNANITSGSIGGLSLVTGCHKTVRVSLQNAMNEVIAAGLANTINYTHANTAGGCYLARFNRLSTNSSIGFLSRHTWGMAIDTNTIGSCQGCAPPDFATNPGGCDTVRIFRKHGFSWGGNFLRPDGMHFEWVGERRDEFPYPSRYCPNVGSGGALLEDLPVEQTQRATLFADDGLMAHGAEQH